MTIGELKQLIKNVSDDTVVLHDKPESFIVKRIKNQQRVVWFKNSPDDFYIRNRLDYPIFNEEISLVKKDDYIKGFIL